MKVITRAFGLALLLAIAAIGTASAADIHPDQAPATQDATAPTNFMSFLNHSIKYYEKLSDNYDYWQIGSDANDYPTMGYAELLVRNTARAEHKWLLAHKPTRACFQAVYTQEILQSHYTELSGSYSYDFYWNYNIAAGSNAVRYTKLAAAATKKENAMLAKFPCG